MPSRIKAVPTTGARPRDCRTSGKPRRRPLLIVVFTSISALLMLFGVAAPAQGAPRFEAFQVQATVIADLPAPLLGANLGGPSGHAQLVAINTHPTAGATAGPMTVRWASTTTGRTGIATFPRVNAQPIDIFPGVGHIVVLIEGGVLPGFGAIYVP